MRGLNNNMEQQTDYLTEVEEVEKRFDKYLTTAISAIFPFDLLLKNWYNNMIQQAKNTLNKAFNRLFKIVYIQFIN